MMKFASPTAFMAQKKETVDEAYAGAIVGLPDNGNFKIGDSLTSGEDIHFKGLPSFSPEMFMYIENADPMKQKQLQKGVDQLMDEGVAQLFTNQFNGRKIIGTVGQNSVVTPLSYEDSMRYNSFFMESVVAAGAGRYASAYDLLKHCIDINPNAAEAYYFLSTYQSELKQDTLAMQSMEKAAKLSPDNDTYQERLAQYCIDFKQYDKAINVYENLAANRSDRTDVLQVLMQLYNQQKDYPQMLKTIDRIEKAEGVGEEITLAKVRVYEDRKSTRLNSSH